MLEVSSKSGFLSCTSCASAGSSAWRGCDGSGGNRVCDTSQFQFLLPPREREMEITPVRWIPGKLRKKTTQNP